MARDPDDEPGRTIRTEIAAHGSIGFDRFMELALYGPGGFYERPPIGTDADSAFATSPHVHEVFATLLATGLREMHRLLGSPEPFHVVEVGAGDGTLADGLAVGLEDLPVRITAVERSPGARATLADRGFHVEEELPHVDGVVVANELLDNLPFRLARGTGDDVREVRVAIADDRFTTELGALDPALRELVGSTPAADEEVAIPTGALAFVEELAARLERGFAILIDYGVPAGSRTGSAGPVHGYRGHRLVEDVLDAPGSSDVTAGVDLRAVADRAEQRGLRVLGTPTQRAALVALGFEAWSRRRLADQGELLNRGDGLEAVRTWSGRSRAGLLVDPSALGRLRWLVLAADGDGPLLPMPRWVDVARSDDR